jgi:4-hydroxy-tetrahydrodipicolinate reductase
VKVVLFGHEGQVGSVLAPALAAAGHEVLGVGSGDQADLDGVDAAIDFTTPEAVERDVRACLEQEVPCVVGTTGWDPEPFSRLAEERGVQLFYAPNFALGAVLMMRFAAEAAKHLPKAEIIELHSDKKKDAPSGTAKATAERLGGAPIHSVRLPGLVAHQAVLLGGDGQLLTIRHDAFSREAYVPGVLLALERLTELPPGLTVGLETLLD